MGRLSREDAEPNSVDIEAPAEPGSIGDATDLPGADILHSLAEAVYATDPQGRITFFNQAAVEMWGVRPMLGTKEFDGIWTLYRPDGALLTPDESPTVLALSNDSAVRGLELLGECADGRSVSFLSFAAAIRNSDGVIVGAVNLLIDRTDRVMVEETLQRLAAVVECSDDAIIAKDINGVITEWNAGAQRLFGYSANEAIGRPVAMLIPEDRPDEEPDILARLRRGERIANYETIRQRKDRTRVEISLSVSPIKNRAGSVVGASKIARDITARRRAEQQQILLLREMNHRIKNLFTLATSIVTLSARSASTPADLVKSVSDRLGALARAQDLTIPQISEAGERTERQTTLQTLIETIVAPYQGGADLQNRILVTCCDFPLKGDAVTGFALLINEFATNAAKYGALSTPGGRVEIHCTENNDHFFVQWTETGGPPVKLPIAEDGFGSRLVKATVEGQLHGQIKREWRSEGLLIHLAIPADQIRAS